MEGLPLAGTRKNDERPTLRQRVDALRYVPPLLKMVWETHRGYASATVALRRALCEEVAVSPRSHDFGLAFGDC